MDLTKINSILRDLESSSYSGYYGDAILSMDSPSSISDPLLKSIAEKHSSTGAVTGVVDPVLNSIYSKYPAFKNMGPVTIAPDPSFTRDKTGVGDIEYFSPEQDKVTYNNGFSYNHPALGTHGIVYNPETNSEQGIMLDMLHGMPSDPIYAKHRGEFKDAFMKSKFGGDLKRGWDEYSQQENDGYDRYIDNEIDGRLRNLMFEGSKADFEKARYWDKAKDVYLSDPMISEKFNQINDYLKVGQGYMLPGVNVYPKKKILPVTE